MWCKDRHLAQCCEALGSLYMSSDLFFWYEKYQPEAPKI